MSTLDTMLVDLIADLTASLDEDTGLWHPCWAQGTALPRNASTEAHYQGLNVLILWAQQIHHRYPTHLWATYKQWFALGGQVRKGERGVHCLKWVESKPDDPIDDTAPRAHSRLRPCPFVVFNAAQQDGWVAPEPPVESHSEALTRFFEAMELVPFTRITGEPGYVSAVDVVMLPAAQYFATPEAFAHTMAHELAHWTGHKSRLNRDMGKRFGDAAYAAEELVAEMSAAFTCATFDLGSAPQRDDHVRYIKDWLSKLQSDPKLLLTAAQHAQQATTHLLEYSCTPTSYPTSGQPVLIASS